MNIKNSNILKNISYSFFANIVSMGISALMIMLLPKFMGVADYGVWQLYLFYVSYLGIFHFGWLDGIYLRYGGCYLEQLDKRKFTSQFLAVFVLETALSGIGAYFVYNYVQDVILRTVLLFASVVLLPTILFTFCSFILQITNNIKQYAQLVLFEKVVFFYLKK
jgi:O-antigen/teichoic acid export membrane protein